LGHSVSAAEPFSPVLNNQISRANVNSGIPFLHKLRRIAWPVASEHISLSKQTRQMNTQMTSKKHLAERSGLEWLVPLTAAFASFAVFQDLLSASLNGYVFYLSESLIFSSFWVLFVPLLYAQYSFYRLTQSDEVTGVALLVLTPVLLHSLAFPAVVWVLSKMFYYHTYEFNQTFRYALAEHLYQIILIYSLPMFVAQLLKGKTHFYHKLRGYAAASNGDTMLTSLILSEGSRRVSVVVSDILYVTSSSPYIAIHLHGKRYLHNETLKSIADKIDQGQFARVHKSTIVNIGRVQFYTSRLNGDYDATMTDGARLRVSRNYAADFKRKLGEGHQLGIK